MAPPPSTEIPRELLDAVRRAQGVDVSDVPIRRGPEVSDEARSLGARSFARGGEVFLPAHEGSPDEPVARGLLAHELTHAAQQRNLGSALPAEDSEAGRALEAQAVAAERWARGLGGNPADSGAGVFGPGAAPGTGAAPGQAAQEAGFSSPTSWSAPWLSGSTNGVQRQTGDVTSAPAPEFTPSPSPASNGTATATMAPLPTFAPPASPTADTAAPQPAPATAAPADHEMHAARDALLALSQRRPLDLDDPADIEELSVRIYQKIHRRLRRDLVVDRERSGRLGETGPFGAAR